MSKNFVIDYDDHKKELYSKKNQFFQLLQLLKSFN